ncbi:MAG: DUF2071 domain-containing protein [Pirellulaceae bacterium]|nr:DUF2071 domain-containing protein [Pirellulaceae bacterium]
MTSLTSDRTWPLPQTPWVMQMTWSDLLFAHWPVDPAVVMPLLPAGLTLDTRDGAAWVGIVPFLMSRVAPRCCPPLPLIGHFPELNVRTYVTAGGKPGVWFFSLDAASRVAVRVARAAFHLPYMDARMSIARHADSTIAYSSHRTHRHEPSANFAASYCPKGDWFRAQPETLEHWLTARYCLYSADSRGRLYCGEIDHPPWTLAPAICETQCNTMCQPLGIELCGHPHLMVAQKITVKAWMISQGGETSTAIA